MYLFLPFQSLATMNLSVKNYAKNTGKTRQTKMSAICCVKTSVPNPTIIIESL